MGETRFVFGRTWKQPGVALFASELYVERLVNEVKRVLFLISAGRGKRHVLGGKIDYRLIVEKYGIRLKFLARVSQE